MTEAFFIKDSIGANVDSSTLSYKTNGINATITSEGQYTYYATATLAGTLDGHDIGTGTQVFNLAICNKTDPAWTNQYCFRSEGSYEGTINDEPANIYAFFALNSTNITEDEGVYTAQSQTINDLTVSNITIYRVLTDALNEELDGSVLNQAWLTANSDWVNSNVINVAQQYLATVSNMTLAQSLEFNTTELAVEQTYSPVQTTVADIVAGATLNTLTLNTQTYDVVVNNSAEVTQYVGTALNEIVTLKEGTVNIQEPIDGNLSGNTYTSSMDGKSYTIKSFAISDGGTDVIYGTGGNDWINGDAGNDNIYGGDGGHDMLSGGTGDDLIVAGQIVQNEDESDITIAGDFVKLNTTGSEIYGGAGADTIYSSKGNDFIWAGSGNDTINLNGGNNTLFFTNTSYDEGGFGSDTINNFTINDTLQFYVKNADEYQGYKLSDLTITGNFGDGANTKADLTIETNDGNTITIKDFFANDANGNNIQNFANLNIISENNASEVLSVTYSTDGKVYVDDVSSYSGAPNFSEVVTLKKANKVIENYVSTKDNKTYQIFATANFEGGANSDYAEGTAYNDILTGGNGADVLLGGSAGHDIINANGGNDYVIAGSQTSSNTDYNIAALDDGENKFYAKFNSTGSELAGGAGNDYIYSSKGNDFIAGNEGNDSIYLNGGINKMYFTENGNAVGTAFGNDTVYGATSKDILQFFSGTGYKLSDLQFTKTDNNLVIDNSNAAGVGAATVTINNFFDGAAIDKLIAGNSENIQTTYSILKDAIINVTLGDATSYTGSNYNESINMGLNNVTFEMGSGKNIINYTVGAMGNSVINLTKGENLNLVFTGDITGMTYATNDNKDLILNVGGNTITINSYLSGKTEANVQINSNDMYNWGTLAAGLNNLAVESTYDSVEAMENKGRLKGTDMSEYFNVANYISDNSIGVNITSGGGDDTVIGSNYNDRVMIKSGNNTITESEGNNNIRTGAGNDIFTATNGCSSNTVYLGDGNNEITLSNIGANRINTGKGNDQFNINSGVNRITTTNGNNIFAINGGINNLSSGKGNDYYNLASGENIIRSGAGSDTFDVAAGVNKITVNGTKNEVSNFDINGGINNIRSGASNDIYLIDGGTNTINSAACADNFTISTASANTIISGTGIDTFNISAGTNIIDTGSDADIVNITNASTNNIKLGAGNDTISITNVASTNIVDAGAGIDTINLAIGNNSVNAGAGNDVINITGGANVVIGGAGNDTFNVGAIVNTNTLNGGAGKDVYDLTNYDFGNDLIITDTSGISTFKLAAVTPIGGAGNGNNYSFFANVTLDNTVRAGYTLSGYTLTNDTVTAGAITGYDTTNEVSIDIGKNRKVDISTGATPSVMIDTQKIASDVASWLSDANHAYASVDTLLQTGNAADINNFLTAFTVDNVAAAV